MLNKWTLHEEPYRHYKVTGPKGKPAWTIDGKRIASVTQVLNGDDRLTKWAASTALGAAEQASRRFFSGVDEALDESVLSYGQLVHATGLMPDQIKDAAGARGTAAHKYLAARLGARLADHDDWESFWLTSYDVEYGHRKAIELFIADHKPLAVVDEHGRRVERAVGSEITAVAGTYDAQVRFPLQHYKHQVHRLDLKSSRTIQPKHFAQVAEYEDLAVRNGEDPSDFLTVLHIDLAGNYRLYSIARGSPEYWVARSMFAAHLEIYRNTSALDKFIKQEEA